MKGVGDGYQKEERGNVVFIWSSASKKKFNRVMNAVV